MAKDIVVPWAYSFFKHLTSNPQLFSYSDTWQRCIVFVVKQNGLEIIFCPPPSVVRRRSFELGKQEATELKPVRTQRLTVLVRSVT